MKVRKTDGDRGRPSAQAALALCAMVVAVLGCGAVGTWAAGCGDPEPAAPKDAAQRMRQVLGRAPTGLAAAIAERGTLEVAVAPDDPPRSYEEGDELKGFDVEVARSVADYLKLEPRLTQPPPEAVPAGLAADRFDVSIGSFAPSEVADDKVAYSDPYYYATGQLLVRAGAAPLQGEEALDGASVGAGVHTVFFRYLRDETSAQVVAFPGDAEALTALEAGHVDAILVGGLTAAEAVEEGRGVELSGKPLMSEPMVFVVKEGEQDLLDVLDEAIAELRGDGTLRGLSEAWFGGLDLTSPRGSPTPG